MVSDEVGTKLLRFLYFTGAGVITTTAINLWRDYDRKSQLKALELKNPAAGAAPATAAPDS